MPLIRKPSSSTETPAPDLKRISEMLVDGSDDERWTAARNSSLLPDALRLLTMALAKERVPQVREALFTALAKIGSSESAAVAISHLRSDDAAQRTAALDALRAMPEAAADRLPGLLNDADADVRLLACEIARALPAEDASQILEELIERELNTNVCAAAIEVLAETGNSASLPVLTRCASRFPKEPFLAFAIKTACDRIGSR